jgi:transcriptional regulator with PAS, ATPase and Fis domain
MQVKLLRVLQEKTYEPLGATESIEHNVRIIAATNKDLDMLAREGHFREDLYYRIYVFKISLPPLRERMEDIPLLIDHFITRFNAMQKKNIQGVSEEAMSILMSYNYPGNIRELANIIEYAFILCKGGLIEKKHLPENIFFLKPDHDENEIVSLRDAEAGYLLKALKQNNWDRLKTARQLGMHKSTLYRKITSFGIKLPS